MERIKGLTDVRKATNEIDICVMECMLCQKVTLNYQVEFPTNSKFVLLGKSKQFR